MNTIKSVLTGLLVTSLSFPVTLFAQTAPENGIVELKAQVARTDSLLSDNGIKMVNEKGETIKLTQLVGEGLKDNSESRVVLSTANTGLSKPVGVLVKKVASKNNSQIKFVVALENDNFSTV